MNTDVKTDTKPAAPVTATATAPPATAAAASAVAKQEAPKKALTIRDHLKSENLMKELATILPKHCSAERMVRVTLTALTKTPKLLECEQASFFMQLMNLSQWGLEPDGRRAHLIPFENRKRGVLECQLIIDYKGLVELALRSGDVESIHADVVCENDVFVVDLGQVVKHEIDYRKTRGAPFAYWTMIKLKSGGAKYEVMTKDEVDAIRARSKSGSSGPWVTDYNEMAKKTVFRRATKWITLSPELRDVIDADYELVSDTPIEKPTNTPRISSLESLTESFTGGEVIVEEPTK
jgi:recombination protein RecT